MSSTKLVIIVLLIIGLLFAISLNIGAFHSDDQTVQPPSWVSSFGDVLARPQPLQLGDLSQEPPNCVKEGKFSVQAGSTCTFPIKKSAFSVRVVLLQLLQGTSATVSLSQEDTVTVQHPFPETSDTTKDDLKVYPGKEHAMLIIQCGNAGAACLLGLK